LLILVTNDDGVFSPGIRALAKSLCALGRVVVVAPDRERSAVSHALTLHSPLRAEEIRPDIFAVDGTPTDCVNLGVHGLLQERPALVVSGINRGGNMGDDLTYSGTVSAAMEATLMGVPAMAVSLDGESFGSDNFNRSARLTLFLARSIVEKGLPPDTFLNINFPAAEPRGFKLTRQGKRRYGETVVEKIDPRGKTYYWLGGGEMGFDNLEGTDFHAVHAGYVSITPLHLDLTNYRSFEQLESWGLDAVTDFPAEPES